VKRSITAAFAAAAAQAPVVYPDLSLLPLDATSRFVPSFLIMFDLFSFPREVRLLDNLFLAYLPVITSSNGFRFLLHDVEKVGQIDETIPDATFTFRRELDIILA